jgi:glycine/serine hydroxymethyltransferase
MKGPEMEHIGAIVGAVLKNPHSKKICRDARKEVKTIAKRFTLFSKEWQIGPDQ